MTAAATEPKPQSKPRIRRKARIRVIVGEPDYADTGTLADKRDAEKWVAENGEPGRHYTIVDVKADGSPVEETKVTRRFK